MLVANYTASSAAALLSFSTTHFDVQWRMAITAYARDVCITNFTVLARVTIALEQLATTLYKTHCRGGLRRLPLAFS